MIRFVPKGRVEEAKSDELQAYHKGYAMEGGPTNKGKWDGPNAKGRSGVRNERSGLKDTPEKTVAQQRQDMGKAQRGKPPEPQNEPSVSSAAIEKIKSGRSTNPKRTKAAARAIIASRRGGKKTRVSLSHLKHQVRAGLKRRTDPLRQQPGHQFTGVRNPDSRRSQNSSLELIGAKLVESMEGALKALAGGKVGGKGSEAKGTYIPERPLKDPKKSAAKMNAALIKKVRGKDTPPGIRSAAAPVIKGIKPFLPPGTTVPRTEGESAKVRRGAKK